MEPYIVEQNKRCPRLNRASLNGTGTNIIMPECLKKESERLKIFPLYTDCMPGITKDYFEYMENNKKILEGKSITFIVHSGFPEAIQSRAVNLLEQ
jgi:hypothetical protein